MKTVRHFNIDQSVNLTCEINCGKVYSLCAHLPNGSDRDATEILGLKRAVNVKAAIESLVSELGASSVKTVCGVVVGNGHMRHNK